MEFTDLLTVGLLVCGGCIGACIAALLINKLYQRQVDRLTREYREANQEARIRVDRLIELIEEEVDDDQRKRIAEKYNLLQEADRIWYKKK